MSFRVDVDVSSISRARQRAQDAFRRMPRLLHETAERYAKELQQSDSYQNRTGSLRHGGVNGPGTVATFNERGELGTTVRVTLEMDTPYARYVIARGFSTWESVWPRCEVALESACERLAVETAR